MVLAAEWLSQREDQAIFRQWCMVSDADRSRWRVLVGLGYLNVLHDPWPVFPYLKEVTPQPCICDRIAAHELAIIVKADFRLLAQVRVGGVYEGIQPLRLNRCNDGIDIFPLVQINYQPI